MELLIPAAAVVLAAASLGFAAWQVPKKANGSTVDSLESTVNAQDKRIRVLEQQNRESNRNLEACTRERARLEELNFDLQLKLRDR